MNRYFDQDDIQFMWIVIVCGISTFGFLAYIQAL